MIKISSWISGTCLIALIILVGIESANYSPPSSVDWGLVSIIAVGVAIGSFALSYLGGHVIRGNKGAIRLVVLISVLWVVGSFVALDPYNEDWTEFVGIGIIPAILYLGILWVIPGFLPKKMDNS